MRLLSPPRKERMDQCNVNTSEWDPSEVCYKGMQEARDGREVVVHTLV